VVSKEEVAVGRKGSGGEWGSTSRNAGLAGPAPQNGWWSNTGKKHAKMSIEARACRGHRVSGGERPTPESTVYSES
jgi:hypothetical protein